MRSSRRRRLAAAPLAASISVRRSVAGEQRAARGWLDERLPAFFVVLLLAATAAAFVRTQQQKLKPSPLHVVHVDELFSPVCRCSTSHATISLRVRTRSRITLTVVNEQGQVVRRLLVSRRLRARSVVAEWNGRDDENRLVPDGVYRPRLRVAAERRTFQLENQIRVDTVPPTATIVDVQPRVLKPIGDGRARRVSVRYRLSERAQPFLYVNELLRVRGFSRKREGKLDWYVKVNSRPARRVGYRLRIGARDDAGNLSRRGRTVVIRAR